jgi:acetyltransferase-like isoleucine patch superfamily enzyme
MVANVLVMLPYCIVQPITLHKDFNNMGIKETQTFNLHSSTIWRTFMGITSLAKYYLKRNPNVIKIVSPIYNHVIGRNHFHIKGKENKISIPNSFLNKSHINIIGSGNEITFGKDCYLINTEIDIRGNNNCIYLGNTVSIKAGKLHIEDSNGQISIGSGTSICGTTLLATIEGRAITIGNDCLFSSDVSFRTGDSHSILDIEGNRINPSQDIFVGNHVWLGNKTILTKGACVADNSVVGTGAIVTKKFTQQNVILAGIPAQILSRNINWDIKCI